jgi:hypothetical protein
VSTANLFRQHQAHFRLCASRRFGAAATVLLKPSGLRSFNCGSPFVLSSDISYAAVHNQMDFIDTVSNMAAGTNLSRTLNISLSACFTKLSDNSGNTMA